MPQKTKSTYSFFQLYDRFILNSQNGRRLQPNGKRVSPGTIENYRCTRRLLAQFCEEKKFDLRLIPERRLTQREAESEKNYWKKFYRRFTDYLYDSLGHFDIYVGSVIKNLKVFFNYLNRELGLGVGDFYKQFYVRKENIAIFPLSPEELNYLIYDEAFAARLTPRMREVKDVFVFGCTVALRVSDLLGLKKSALRVVGGHHYLSVRSQKTSTDTVVKLPAYALSILRRYGKKSRLLLPHFNAVSLNKYIKILLRLAGFTQPVALYRERRGRAGIPLTNLVDFPVLAPVVYENQPGFGSVVSADGPGPWQQ